MAGPWEKYQVSQTTAEKPWEKYGGQIVTTPTEEPGRKLPSWIRPTMEAGGSVLGTVAGVAATPFIGPAAPFLGGGLGYMAGEKIADIAETFAGERRPEGVVEQIKRLPSSAVTAAKGEALGLVGGKVITGLVGKAISPLSKETAVGVKTARELPKETAKAIGRAEKFGYKPLPSEVAPASKTLGIVESVLGYSPLSGDVMLKRATGNIERLSQIREGLISKGAKNETIEAVGNRIRKEAEGILTKYSDKKGDQLKSLVDDFSSKFGVERKYVAGLKFGDVMEGRRGAMIEERNALYDATKAFLPQQGKDVVPVSSDTVNTAKRLLDEEASKIPSLQDKGIIQILQEVIAPKVSLPGGKGTVTIPRAAGRGGVETDSLTDFIRKAGGISTAIEKLKGEVRDTFSIKEGYNLINNKTGKSLDNMTERAIESGYLKEGATTTDLLDMLRKDVMAKKAGQKGAVWSMARQDFEIPGGEPPAAQKIREATGLTWEGLKNSRSDLLEKVRTIVKEKGEQTKESRVYSELADRFDKDMASFAEKQGGELWDTFSKAREKARFTHEVFDKDMLKIMQKNPEDILDKIVNKGEVTLLSQVRLAGGDEAMEPLRQGFFKKILDSSVDKSGFIDPSKLRGNIAKITDDTVLMLATPEQKAALEGIANQAEKINLKYGGRKTLEFLETLAGTNNDKIVTSIVQPENVANIRLAKRLLSPQRMKDITSSILEKKIFKISGDGRYMPVSTAKEANKYRTALKQLMPADQYETFNEFLKLGNNAMRAERLMINASQTGQVAGGMAILRDMVAGRVGEAAKLTGLPWLVSKAYTSPQAMRYLTSAMKPPPDSPLAIAQFIKGINIIAGQEEKPPARYISTLSDEELKSILRRPK